MRHFHLQHHDGDDDGEHAVTEGLKYALPHIPSHGAKPNVYVITSAAGASTKTINRKTVISAAKESSACATPIHILIAATANQIVLKIGSWLNVIMLLASIGPA